MCAKVNKANKLWLLTLQVQLAEAKEKYEEAMKNNSQLENMNIDLTNDVLTLQESLEELKHQFSEAESTLQAEIDQLNEQLSDTLIWYDEETKVSEKGLCIKQFL